MMDFRDAINNGEAFLPNHKAELENAIRKLDSIESWIYNPSVASEDDIYQGDVSLASPICFVDEDGDVVRGVDNVVFVSNTCDMQRDRNDRALAAQIIPLEDYISELKANEVSTDRIENIMRDIRGNRLFPFFYLPKTPQFRESFVDLLSIYPVDNGYINALKIKAKDRFPVSLSLKGRLLLMLKITYFFARAESRN